MPEESLYGAELGQMESLDFLGAFLEHNIAMGIAQGDLDPINLTDFATSEIDLRVMEKICGKKRQSKWEKQQIVRKGSQIQNKKWQKSSLLLQNHSGLR